jgi:hypothetical protein
VQCHVSVTSRKGILRGLHFQAAPFAETKLVRCTRGAIYNVVLDFRSNSPTFRDWMAVVLTAEKRNMVYVPEGCGHGFLALEDDITLRRIKRRSPLQALGIARWVGSWGVADGICGSAHGRASRRHDKLCRERTAKWAPPFAAPAAHRGVESSLHAHGRPTSKRRRPVAGNHL